MKLAILCCLGVMYGQYLNPQGYVNQNFGVMYSYGPAVFCCSGDEVNGTIPSANTFNPTSLDLDQWLDVAVAGGAKYVALTTKYHMGLALWPTSFTVSGTGYSIAQSSWYASHGNYDIVGNFATKARARGLNVVWYFSIWDRKYEALSGTTASSNPAAYLSMIETELGELLTNYGPITAIWLDGYSWHVGYNNIPFSTIQNFVRSIQPNCLVFDNNHTLPSTADIDIYEKAVDGLPPANNTRPAEFNTAVQVNGSGVPDYSWVSGHSVFPAYRLAEEWFLSNARNASFLLNLGPDTTGQVPADQLATFRETAIYRSGVAWAQTFSLGKVVTASSTDTVDGTNTAALTDGVYENSGITQIWAPAVSTASWAEVDLGSVQPITRIDAFNRTDCCKGGMRDIVFTIYDGSHSLVYTSATLNANNGGQNCSTGPASLGVLFTTSVRGRYVRITDTLGDSGCGFALSELSVRSDGQNPGTRGTHALRGTTVRR